MVTKAEQGIWISESSYITYKQLEGIAEYIEPKKLKLMDILKRVVEDDWLSKKSAEAYKKGESNAEGDKRVYKYAKMVEEVRGKEIDYDEGIRLYANRYIEEIKGKKLKRELSGRELHIILLKVKEGVKEEWEEKKELMKKDNRWFKGVLEEIREVGLTR